jgi:hypothetical protein
VGYVTDVFNIVKQEFSSVDKTGEKSSDQSKSVVAENKTVAVQPQMVLQYLFHVVLHFHLVSIYLID